MNNVAELNATELLKYAKDGNCINGKILAYKNIKVGSIVRRINDYKIVYMVECFFNGKEDGLMVGGTPPTVWDKVDDVELCPVSEIPNWMYNILSETIFRIEVYRSNYQKSDSRE